MEKVVKKIVLTVIICLLPVYSINSQTLAERLSPIKPFLDKTWKGDLKSPEGEIISVEIRTFESLSDGKIIKAYIRNEGNSNRGEGYFYWDDIAKRIAFFFLESSGVFNTGFVSAENNIITIEGKMTWPAQSNPEVKQSYDFKNTFEFTADGKMIDRWYHNAFGPWRPGHVIEFTGYQ